MLQGRIIMKRKYAAGTVALFIGASLLAGCSNVTEQNGTAGQSSAAAGTDTESIADTTEQAGVEETGASDGDGNGEITEIVWQYPAWGEVSQGFYAMEDAVNKMTEKDIGIHITFDPTGLQESQNDAILKVSSGEPLDICLTAFTSPGPLVDKGLIIPLDDYLDEETTQVFIDHNADPKRASYDGKIYGIAPGDKTYSLQSYVLKKSFADKYGIKPDPDKIYTLDEMEAIFDEISAGENGDVKFQIPWNNTYEPLNYSLCEYDKLGGDLSFGVLMLNKDFSNTTITDLFETPEYKEYCERMYRWAQKGYISADAAVTTDAPGDLAKKDDYAGWFGWGAPDDSMLDTGTIDCVQFKVMDGCVISPMAGIMWNVTVNCEHPELAVKAIRYLYEHPEMATLIQYGFEGEEYEVVDEKDGIQEIKYANDDMTQLPYLNPYGLWGDRLDMPTVAPVSPDYPIKAKAYQKEVEEKGRVTPSAGYAFKSADVASEVAAVQTVISQYAPSLNAGAIDPADALPDFIDGLKAAGIDSIIAENQRQFDAWLAENK